MTTIIHAGWPKTGTTALQQRFFPRIPDSAVLNPLPNTSRYRQLVDDLQTAENETYRSDVWSAFLDESRGDASTLIVSWEGFCMGREAIRTADRLHAATPDARVVLCVRNQHALLASRYAQHVRAGGYQSFPDWLSTVVPERTAYDTIVRHYQQLFGTDHVMVMAYEHLVADPTRFLDRLAAFVCPGEMVATEPMAQENISLSPAFRWIARKNNRLFRQSNVNPDPLLNCPRVSQLVHRVLLRADRALVPSRSRGLSTRSRQLTSEWCSRYAESNDRLRELTGLPLAELGYPLPDPG